MITHLLALFVLSHLCTAQTKYQVEGTVSELATNAAVEDAEVTLAGSDTKATVQTDKTGHCGLWRSDLQKSVTFTWNPKTPSATIDFGLPRESVISGRITNASKNPMIGMPAERHHDDPLIR